MARKLAAAVELRGVSCSLTLKVPPALRRAAAGADGKRGSVRSVNAHR